MGGGKNPKICKIPDFGRFALGIWPKNTTQFSAAFGGHKGAKQGGGGKNPKNTTDVGGLKISCPLVTVDPTYFWIIQIFDTFPLISHCKLHWVCTFWSQLL